MEEIPTRLVTCPSVAGVPRALGSACLTMILAPGESLCA
ncbi:hypothetical protein ACVILH_004575 [Bradyrhizobium sp. USDA 4353]